jgi:dienelactone hydrolase
MSWASSSERHAIFQYREEAQQRGVILLAPQAVGDPGDRGDPYLQPDGKQDMYRQWDMETDRDHILTILDDVLARFPVDRRRVALLGFSSGCEMGWRLLAARPETFCFFGGAGNGFRHGKPPAPERALRQAARHVPHFYAAGAEDDFAGPMFKTTARKLKQYCFELKTAFPPGVRHTLPSSIKTPLLAFLDEVRARGKAAEQTPGRPPSRRKGPSVGRRTAVYAAGGAVRYCDAWRCAVCAAASAERTLTASVSVRVFLCVSAPLREENEEGRG